MSQYEKVDSEEHLKRKNYSLPIQGDFSSLLFEFARLLSSLMVHHHPFDYLVFF